MKFTTNNKTIDTSLKYIGITLSTLFIVRFIYLIIFSFAPYIYDRISNRGITFTTIIDDVYKKMTDEEKKWVRVSNQYPKYALGGFIPFVKPVSTTYELNTLANDTINITVIGKRKLNRETKKYE